MCPCGVNVYCVISYYLWSRLLKLRLFCPSLCAVGQCIKFAGIWYIMEKTSLKLLLITDNASGTRQFVEVDLDRLPEDSPLKTHASCKKPLETPCKKPLATFPAQPPGTSPTKPLGTAPARPLSTSPTTPLSNFPYDISMSNLEYHKS